MATQGLPLISGGPDANLRVGNIFMLYTVDQDRDEREAAQAAARAYLQFPARPSTGSGQGTGGNGGGAGGPERTEPYTTKEVALMLDLTSEAALKVLKSAKVPGVKQKRPGALKLWDGAAVEAMLRGMDVEVTPSDAVAVEPETRNSKPGTLAEGELPSVVTLYPEISIDAWERERSQMALCVWCNLTKRQPLANQWRALMASRAAAGFKHPMAVMSEKSGRAAQDAQAAAVSKAGQEKKQAEYDVERAGLDADGADTEAGEDEGVLPDDGGAEVSGQDEGVNDDPQDLVAVEEEMNRVRMSAAEAKALGLGAMIEGDQLERLEPDPE